MVEAVISNMQPNVIPSKLYSCVLYGVSPETSTCSFLLRSKHVVLRWPVAKIRLSEAGGVGIRVNLRTSLVERLWPGLKFSLRPG